jgi:hypothetical protein
MTTPKNGDFASHVNDLTNQLIPEQKLTLQEPNPNESQASQLLQWLQAGTPELSVEEEQKLIQEIQSSEAEHEGSEPLSDEEFERQALEAGGDDNDSSTPE